MPVMMREPIVRQSGFHLEGTGGSFRGDRGKLPPLGTFPPPPEMLLLKFMLISADQVHKQ